MTTISNTTLFRPILWPVAVKGLTANFFPFTRALSSFSLFIDQMLKPSQSLLKKILADFKTSLVMKFLEVMNFLAMTFTAYERYHAYIIYNVTTSRQLSLVKLL